MMTNSGSSGAQQHCSCSDSRLATARRKQQQKCMTGIFKYIPVCPIAAHSIIIWLYQMQVPRVVKPLTNVAKQGSIKNDKYENMEPFRESNLRPYYILKNNLHCKHPMSSPHRATNKKKSTGRSHRLYCTSAMIVSFFYSLARKRKSHKKMDHGLEPQTTYSVGHVIYYVLTCENSG